MLVFPTDNHAKKIAERVSEHCRLLFSYHHGYVPQHSQELARRMTIALKKYAIARSRNPDDRSIQLEVESLPCVVETIMQPVELVGWSSERISAFGMEKLLDMVKDTAEKNQGEVAEMLFGVAHHEVKGMQ